MASDRGSRLSLRIEDSIQPVLDSLLSQLPVPIDVDRINDYAEAPEITCREEVQEGLVVVPT